MIRIAIDGPSGAGKSTISKAVAAKLGIIYVDTGALYRTIGYYVKSKGVNPKDSVAVTALLPEISIDIKYENSVQHVYLNGENLGDKIRTPEMSMYASDVSAIETVRTFLLDTQREIAKNNSVIMDGRDIGTVILPHADVKIFLTASVADRAMRRVRDLENKGISANYDDVLREMTERDNNDKNRSIAPAVAAEDAVLLDNSGFEFEQSVEAVISIVNEKINKVEK
jgi:cytidylate kinase